MAETALNVSTFPDTQRAEKLRHGHPTLVVALADDRIDDLRQERLHRLGNCLIHLVPGGQGSLPLKTRSFLDFCVPRLRAALADLLPASADLEVPGLSSS